MIQGLRITIGGEAIRRLLGQRIEQHRHRADHWKREQARTPDEQTDEHPLLPEHICENEAERHTWRAEVLEFIRDNVDPSANYLLSEADLAFGELLPEMPGSLKQEEYEERTAIAFNLERLTKRRGSGAAPH